jgi:hypothetical protein
MFLLSKRPFSPSDREKSEFSIIVDHFLLCLAPDPYSELQRIATDPQRLFNWFLALLGEVLLSCKKSVHLVPSLAEVSVEKAQRMRRGQPTSLGQVEQSPE